MNPPVFDLRPFIEIAKAETAIRLGNYDRLDLPTDQSSGNYTRSQRQLGGVFGEIGYMIYNDDPPKGPWSTTKLDGGCDYRMPSGKTVNVKTAMGYCRYCYYPPFIPLKSDWIVQAQLRYNPLRVALLGCITVARFKTLAILRPIPVKEYASILVSQMTPLPQVDSRYRLDE